MLQDSSWLFCIISDLAKLLVSLPFPREGFTFATVSPRLNCLIVWPDKSGILRFLNLGQKNKKKKKFFLTLTKFLTVANPKFPQEYLFYK